MRKQYALEVHDSVFDPERPSGEVRYRGDEKRPLYQVWLFLDGTDLPYVTSVEYELHETFKNRFLTVERTPSNPLCKVAIWAWGAFTIRVQIRTKMGDAVSLEHRLTYGSQIQQKGLRFVRS